MNRSKKLSVSRTELDEVLGTPDYAPKSLISLFERDLSKEFNADSGVREQYSIKRHTLMVMSQFEKYFSRNDLPAGVSSNFFRVFLALHDIGKSEAINKTGDKRNQHRYTISVMSAVFSQLEFSDRETKIALALVS